MSDKVVYSHSAIVTCLAHSMIQVRAKPVIPTCHVNGMEQKEREV